MPQLVCYAASSKIFHDKTRNQGATKGVKMGPQPVDDNNTNISGISDGLQGFLTDWGNDEVEPEDVAKMLHSPQGTQYQGWLPQELTAAYQKGVLTPEFLSMACNRDFDSPQAVGQWLQAVWPTWFDQPFPVAVAPAPDSAPTPDPSQAQNQNPTPSGNH
jgi:hypothetical protein